MKNPPILCLLVVLSLGGCASEPKGLINRIQALGPDKRCTDVIAKNGGLLKFCQTSDNVTVYESGVNVDEYAKNVSVINNPRALRLLQDELSLRRELHVSRRMIAKSCSISGTRYVNVALSDLKRIVSDSGSVAQERPGARAARR